MKFEQSTSATFRVVAGSDEAYRNVELEAFLGDRCVLCIETVAPLDSFQSEAIAQALGRFPDGMKLMVLNVLTKAWEDQFRMQREFKEKREADK